MSKKLSNKQHGKIFDDILKQMTQTKGVRHVIMAAETMDGSFAWAKAEGIAHPDGTPMDVETPFWIASITKLYIACCILKFHEDGLLSIDDLITKHLSTDLIKGIHTMGCADNTGKLTIRHLLTHSSGIPDYLEIKADGEKTIIDQVLEVRDMSWSVKEIIKIVREENSPVFPPQSLDKDKYKIRYSDTNFQLLTAIIEATAGKPAEEVYRDIIFKPLNLNNTYLPGSVPLKANKKASTIWIGDVALEDKPKALRSFGDLNSTVKDQVSFMRALLEGKLFKNKETLDLMRKNWQTFGFSLSPISPGWPIQYSMGMMRFKTPRFLSPFQAVPEIIGHTGAVGSWLFYCPLYDLILSGSVSQVTAAAAPFKYVPKLLKALGK